ncbi:type IV secretory system conjugative DNA transfer family protein [Burkholderia gladioli]|uniref:type IV secretory system conjugative DNA transfer family protein n=1 Tax=Burkholderia gladioli TaxID=28095 RepID=UPI001641BFD5|nr:type IV secretory system conjugative DNA transfer family protein [Burkholderia gladioli]
MMSDASTARRKRIGSVISIGLLIVGFSCFVVVGQYLGAMLFVRLEKIPTAHVGVWTLRDYWQWYGDIKAVKRSLAVSSVVAAAPPLGQVAILIAVFMKRPARPLYGDARFARAYEIRDYGLLDEALQIERTVVVSERAKGAVDPRSGKATTQIVGEAGTGRWGLVRSREATRDTRGDQGHRRPTILVGKVRYKGRDMYLTFAGQQFVMVIAAPRTGKGTAIAIPNFLTYSDSMVGLDVKGEAYDITSGFRERCGQKVFRWAPFDDTGLTHRWNPLEQIANSEPHVRVGRLQAIAARLYHTADNRNKFFYEQASDLFVALGLYLMETRSACTFGEILRSATTPSRKVRDHLNDLTQHERKEGGPLSGDCLEAFTRVLASPDETMLNIVATFNSGLRLFSNPIVDLSTSKCDFDVSQVRRQLMTIYVVLPVRELALAGLLGNMFFTQWIEQNIDKLPAQDPTLKYQCLGLLDEFTALGRIDILDKASAFIPGYNLRLLTIMQSRAQGEDKNLYGVQGMRTLETTHAVSVVYAPHEEKDAEEISKSLGTYTEKATSNSRSYGRQSSRGTNTSDQRRPLMLPQELKEMAENLEIIRGFTHPIMANKAHYYADWLFMDRLVSVSPGLRRFKRQNPKRFPTKDEFEAIWQTGELRAKNIVQLDPKRWHDDRSSKSAAAITLARQAGAKPMTAAEQNAIDLKTPSREAMSSAIDGLLRDYVEVSGEAVPLDVIAITQSVMSFFTQPVQPSAHDSSPLTAPI